MRRHLGVFTAWLLGVTLIYATAFPEGSASLEPGESFQQLAQQLKSPEHIAHFMWRRFSLITDQTQFGKEDYWQTPEELLVSGKGDCEDLASFASEMLKLKGIPSLLINIYGGRFPHAVCIFKEKDAFNVIDVNGFQRYPGKDLKQLLSSIDPFWENGAIVTHSPHSRRGKILAKIERRIREEHRFRISA